MFMAAVMRIYDSKLEENCSFRNEFRQLSRKAKREGPL
jgi:hypothetical protein